jgi:membrane protease YdiL (CAAX protease family)
MLPAMSHLTPLDLVIVAYALVAVPVLSMLTGRALNRERPGERRLLGRYWIIIARGIVVSLLILLDWHWTGRPWITLGLDVPVGFRGRAGFGLDALIIIGYASALLLPKLSAERAAASQRRLDSLLIIPHTRQQFAIWPFMAVVGSTTEELLYRGFLMWTFAPLAGLWGAVLLSSAMFGLAHIYQGRFGILRTSIIGAAFGTAYALTHSLWWLIVVHIALNLLGGLFAWRIRRVTSVAAR